MNLDFTDFLDAVSGNEFETTPVDLHNFLYDKEYLGLNIKLSPIQEDIIERGSQIYKRETLVTLFGKQEAEDKWKKTTRDLLLALGKGSGKDMMSQLLCLYVIYKLLCLKDPAEYFGKPSGDAIDICNLALNANQAKRVFFDGLVARLNKAPWFQGKYDAKIQEVKFDKNINLYSMHSDHEAAEGLNLILVVLDELDGFTIDGYSTKVYNALSATVSSRFDENGKVVTLSFPRSKNGFIMSKYNEAVVETEPTEHSHTFKLNESLPDDTEGNEFTVHWTEEIATGYKYDNFYALKAPTFRVNPTKTINSFKMDFYSNEEDALMRFCANPPDSDNNSFFKNHNKLEAAFDQRNGWSDEYESLLVKGDEDKTYYIHIDLSKVHDRTVVSMGHVDKWVQVDMGTLNTDPAPFIVIDLFRIWEPTKANPVNHGEVMAFILDLCRKFKVEIVTFDQWGSANMIEHLESVGIKAKKKSLGRSEYQEFLMVVGEERIKGPYDRRFLDELKHLVLLPDGKVDHPKKNHNDISESVCGVIRNCVQNELEETGLQVMTLTTVHQQLQQETNPAKVTKSKQEMPGDIEHWLNSLKGI